MTDADRQVATLLRTATDDLGTDPTQLVAGGLARGRRRVRRRQLSTAVVAASVVAVVGIGLSLRGGEVRTAVDPVQPADQTTASAAPTPALSPTPSPTPGPAAPRALAIKAAALPSTFAALLPGEVIVPAPKDGETNPMDGFDPRRDAATTTFPTTEPGPGIYASLVWRGHPVIVSVAPTEPSYGDTALERCVGGGEDGDNGVCVPTDDGGAIQTTAFSDPDGGEVRIVNVYTPDLWEVTATNIVDPGGPTLDQLRTVATSDVWFEAP